MVVSPPAKCGPFDLLERIGHGATGHVWKALHRGSGIEVALKVFDHARARSAFSLQSEVRAAARLEHPNIVMLFEQGSAVVSEPGKPSNEGDRTPYLAMEYCSGGALSDARTRAPWSVLRQRLQSILEALAHAHARGVIHRDLKPSNVLLSPTEGGEFAIKLSDFGIAHALVDASTAVDEADPRSGRLSGTLHYMAPEQLAGSWRDEGPWTDLYALGVIAYEATTGTSPWKARDRKELMAHLVKSAPPLRARMPVPEGLQGWVDGLLAKGRNDRYQSAAAALHDLLSLGEPHVWGQSSPPTHVPVARALPSPKATPVRELALQGIGLSLYGLRPTQMVGRVPQREQSWHDLTRAIDGGQPFAIMLEGAMGVGTSKLANWLSEHAHASHGALRLRASHSPIPGPTDGLASMLRRHLHVAGLDETDLERRSTGLIADHPLPDDTDIEAISLAALLAPQPGDSSHAPVMAERARTIQRYLRRTARRQPIVLTVENAHWAHNTLAVCQDILDSGHANLPIVFLLLVDEEALARGAAERQDLLTLAAHERCRVQTLGPLSEDEHRELITRTLGLSPNLVDLLTKSAKGDALHSASLLRYWVQADKLVATSHGFEFRDPDAANVPESLVAVWDAQLDVVSEQLSDTSIESLQTALEIAAALGAGVQDTEWRAACAQAGVSVPDALAQALAEINVVRISRFGWHFRHQTFRHHLVQRARREGRWKKHNDCCAIALEKLARVAPSRGAARLQGRIGRHLLRAGRHEDACEPLLSGAILARNVSNWASSHRLFDLLSEATKVVGNRRMQVEADLERVPCYISEGRLKKAMELSRRVFDAANGLGDSVLQARANMALAAIEFARSETDNAAALLEVALEQLGPYEPLRRVQVLTKLGSLCMWRRDLGRASRYFREAQEIVGDDPAYRAERGHTLRGMAHLAHCHGDYAGATRMMEEAKQCFEDEGNRYISASCINDLGDLLRHQGKLAESEVHYRDALALFESLQAVDAVTAQCNLGYVLVERGQHREAQELFRTLLDTSQTRERQIDTLWILCGLLACVAAEKNWTEWDALQVQIEQRSDKGLVDEDLAGACRLAAGLARRAGHYERARWAYRYALDHYDRMEKAAEAAVLRDLLADLC